MPIVTLAPRPTSFSSGGIPIGSASAWRNLAGASASGTAEGGGAGAIRVRSRGKRTGTLEVPQLTMNSSVRAIEIRPRPDRNAAGRGDYGRLALTVAWRVAQFQEARA